MDDYEYMSAMRRIMTALAALLALMIMWMAGGCSAGYYLRKARAKDPRLFDTTMVMTRHKVKTPVVDFEFECPTLSGRKIELYQPIVDTVEGLIYRDSVRIVLQAVDSSMIRAEVDCPDPVVVTKTVTQTVNVPPKPVGLIDKLLEWVAVVVVVSLLYVAVKIIIPLVR